MEQHIKICDIEGCNNVLPNNSQTEYVLVISNTNQKSGETISPFILGEDIYICSDCTEKRLQGEAIYSTGKYGHDQLFYFQEKNTQFTPRDIRVSMDKEILYDEIFRYSISHPGIHESLKIKDLPKNVLPEDEIRFSEDILVIVRSLPCK